MDADAVHRGLNQLEAAADGSGVERARAARADERTVNALDDEVALDVEKLEIGADGIEGHVAVHAVHGDVARIGANLELALFRHGDDVIGFQFVGGRIVARDLRFRFDAIAGLFGGDLKFVARVIRGDHHLRLIPGFHLEIAARIANRDDRLACDRKMFLEMMRLRGSPDKKEGSHRGNRNPRNARKCFHDAHRPPNVPRSIATARS